MNPYLITEPQVVSFSGGRTSGFMLWQIVQAHGGTLPDYVKVCFANTGIEHSATLDFVQAVSDNITPVTWIEYVNSEEGKNTYRVVDYQAASRNGEPMEAIITKRPIPPNVVSRYCTAETKIRPIAKYIKESTGWRTWTDLIGLRADEPRRVHRLKSDGNREILCPMYRYRTPPPTAPLNTQSDAARQCNRWQWSRKPVAWLVPPARRQDGAGRFRPAG